MFGEKKLCLQLSDQTAQKYDDMSYNHLDTVLECNGQPQHIAHLQSFLGSN